MEFKALTLEDYWKALRRSAKCSEEEALWIILEDISWLERDNWIFRYKDADADDEEHFVEFLRLLEDFKMVLKGRINRYNKQKHKND